MSIDEAVFRQALSRFASGVTVVTTSYQGKLYGITVSAFCSLSLNPRLVLICIEKSAPSHYGLHAAGFFAVNILSEHQEPLSRQFASRVSDKFEGIPYRLGRSGAPLLEGCLATLECRTTEALPGGDHTIFLGEVLAATTDGDAPLLYYRGDYRRLLEQNV